METTTNPRPWLDRLKRHLGRDPTVEVALAAMHERNEEVPKGLESPTDKTDNTHAPKRFVGFVGDSPQDHGPVHEPQPEPEEPRESDEAAIAWRVEALRPCIAHLGLLDPIRLPPVRDGVSPLCSQDPLTGDITYAAHCGSCGEPREIGQLFHCRACQRAHHLVLLELREGVRLQRGTAE